MKKIAILPTLLTLGNAVCGFASVACASKIGIESVAESDKYFAYSGWFIIGAMVFDALDGYVARLSKTASDFGMQLDSLCDAISFGLAPAFILLRLGPGAVPSPKLHQALAVIAAFYMVCAILRLARFNIEATAEPKETRKSAVDETFASSPSRAAALRVAQTNPKRFRGLPSPGAAGCLAALAILRGEMSHPLFGGDLSSRWLEPDLARKCVEVFSPFGALAIALLMVSRIPFPHLTKQILRGRRPFSHLIQVVLVGFVILLIPDVALVLLFWIYALGIPFRYFIAKSLRPGSLPTSAGIEEPQPH